MTKETEAMKLALEALEGIHPGNMTPMAEEYWNKAITALREAQAESALERMAENARELGLDYEQPAQQQEPVAVHQFRKRGCSDWYDGHPDHTDGGGLYEARTLYTSPSAQRTWVGLTDDDEVLYPYPPAKPPIYATAKNTKSVRDGYELGGYEKEAGYYSEQQLDEFAKTLEAKLKEKNT